MSRPSRVSDKDPGPTSRTPRSGVRPVVTRRLTPLFLAALILGASACGSDAPGAGAQQSPRPAPTSSSGPSPAQTNTPVPKPGSTVPAVPKFDGTQVTVVIADGEVRTAKKRVVVPLRGKVRLVITSDAADEVHVHGVDKYVDLTPGKPATYDFTASIPGTFEVELHQAGDLLFTMQVQP